MMSNETILYVTDNALVVFECKDDLIFKTETFSRDGIGIVQYGKFLSEHTKDTFAILLNSVEEQYKLDNIPHISKRQNLLLSRQLNKQFRGNSYRYGTIQGRETFGKKEDKILLTTVGNEELLTTWLKPLLDRKISVVGIFSLPLLTEKVTSQLGLNKEKLLVVTLDSTQLRLTFLDGNQFKVSRSIRATTNDPGTMCQEINDEIVKTLRYLGRIRLLSPNQKCDILFISSNKVTQIVSNNPENNATGEWIYLDSDDINSITGQHSHSSDDNFMITELFLYIYKNAKPTNHYATASHTRYYNTKRLKRPIILSSAAILLILMLFSAVLLIDTKVLDIQLAKTSHKLQIIKSNLAISESKLPDFPLNADTVKASVSAVNKLLAEQPRLKRPLIVFSNIFSEFENFEIDYLRWNIDRREVEDTNPDIKDQHVSDDDTEMADVEVDTEMKIKWVPVITVTGKLQNFSGNYVSANISIEKLINKLKKNTIFHSVVATKKPISNSPEEKIDGAITVGQKNKNITNEYAEFSLELVINESEIS